MQRAYAKINIGLRIADRRPDGYHEIETIFHRVNLYDEILFRPAGRINVSSTDPAVPVGKDNICYKAAQVLQHHLGVTDGADIMIHKSIPLGAGLGGGSADAGLLLRELPRLWGRAIDEAALFSLALELGSDVPYFLGRGVAHARGRGEILEYFDLGVPYTILLCNPGISVSTAWAYRQVGPAGQVWKTDLKTLVMAGMDDPSRLREEVQNDFEPAVFSAHPEIRHIKQTLYENGAVFALMSGSGSSVFGMFTESRKAREALQHLASVGYQTALTPPGFAAK
ncbi:MAG: 4-(cytidine 5'-diphospho)-2-C-methyl-D-erythritol kinase [Bacteroidota bacterium]